ncbi:hypothetical protein [Georgenia faecalis]|uniref:Leucine rich repeat variant domain-containing protein n=1 Tax=Georgenia faecalis TaxID=2483799 RepID=A0ABV9D9N6_9MICO|nr:hypothetical protein [Georgenia faecalis]
MKRAEDFTVYEAINPATPGPELLAMAERRPDLRSFVAGNPAAPAEALALLAKVDDVAVTAALARRAGAGAEPPFTDPAPQGYAPPAGPPGYAPPNPSGYAPPAGPQGYAPPGPGGYAPPSAGGYAPPSLGTRPGSPSGSPAAQPGEQVQWPPQLSPWRRRISGKAAAVIGLVLALLVLGAIVVAAALAGAADGGSEADRYGDDPELDQLWDACERGDGAACDDLFWQSPWDSEYEEFGNTCGNRFPDGAVVCEQELRKSGDG